MGWCGGACAREQSHSDGVGWLRASVREEEVGKGVGMCRRGEGRVVVTWMHERITWYGYVAQSATRLDVPDMSMYAMLDCM